MNSDYRLSVLRPQYEEMLGSCRIRTAWVERVKAAIAKMESSRDRYSAVAEAVNVKMPWWFVGIIHGLEASFDWNSHLHNGDSLKNRTTNVPSGRPVQAPGGSGYTWEESAIDALTLKEYDKSQFWDDAAILWRLEGYNGFGYRPKKIHSPYLWSGTSHYEKGKFVADGRYDSNAASEQVGAAAMMMLLKKTPVAPLVTAVSGGIDLEQVCNYYQKLPHQIAALQWLQTQVSPEALEQFALKWRSGSQQRTIAFMQPNKNGIAAKATFEMDLRQSSALIEGQLTFYNASGEAILTCTATSGLPGYQTSGNFRTRRRGPCPPAKNLQISTHGYHLETIGVEGMAYPILPNTISEYGRSEIMLHRDANAPGSSGCIVVRSTRTFEDKVCPLMDKSRKAGVDAIPVAIKYS